MARRLLMVNVCALLVGVMVPGCASLSHRELEAYKRQTLYTCCNIHYENAFLDDANYYVGRLLPLGTPVHVDSAGHQWIMFTCCADPAASVKGAKMMLLHEYGRGQESFRQYVDKVFVAEDPQLRVASFPRDVQQAIRDGRVERGMTREQVLLSLGYPPTHETPSTAAKEWKYWYGQFATYRVIFDDMGKVAAVIGRAAPTGRKPIKPVDLGPLNPQ